MFLADALGADFLNSIATPVDTPVEWIGSGKDLLDWLDKAQLVPAEALQAVRDNAGPGELDAIATQARSLREWFRAFVVKHKGKPIPAKALRELEPLNKLLARDEAYRQIVAAEDDHAAHGLMLGEFRRWRSPEALLLPIAQAMADLVCKEDFTYVKACEGPACTLMFVDKTKGHARRWCSMAICGNRAKQAAHRSRGKAR
ncbi:MAG TPA: ABATE domain-containing protein [Oxalicibacterium sp.]|nr:ABATE domain-containing protein [Oxalicibacterium sp.]